MRFSDLCNDATAGNLHIPEFQRDFRWRTMQVKELFDSMRSGFPIGAMLLMDPNEELKILPRPFFPDNDGGVEIQPEGQSRLILDGQQRITSGLILFHHAGTSAYFVSLQAIEEYLREVDDPAVKSVIAGEVDDDIRSRFSRAMRALDLDAKSYLVRRNLNLRTKKLTRQQIVARAEQQLTKGFVPTWLLWTQEGRAKIEDEIDHAFGDEPGRARLYKRIAQHCVPNDHEVPVEVLGSGEPVEAITRIFEKINNTGLALTPLELVVAVLYPNDVRLRDLISDAHDSSLYLENADPEGIGTLQTMALLARLPPKKSKLPKTVLAPALLANFDDRFQRAVTAIDRVSELLSNKMGVALDYTEKLLPYEAAIPPMAAAFERATAKGMRNEAEPLIEEWFVKSALSQRYQEGTHNKQSADLEAFDAWLADGVPPQWVSDFTTPLLLRDSVGGAVGRLIQCMLNRREPKDPVTGTRVGYPTLGTYQDARGKDAEHVLNLHHIFPKEYAGKVLGLRSGNFDVVLNTMFLTRKTNLEWKGHDPATHLQMMGKGQLSGVTQGSFASQYLGASALGVLARDNKTPKDFEAFLRGRRALLLEDLEHWGVAPPAEDAEEAEEELQAAAHAEPTD